MAPMLMQEVDDEAVPSSKLQLTPVESTLRRLLLDVAAHIDEHPSTGAVDPQVHLPDDLVQQPLVLRFTGGWVRDKLLGVGSHDIDVGINKMTGYQFGLRLKEYLDIPGNPEKYGLEGVATSDSQNQKAAASAKSKTVVGLHKIEANPEKSKHLETVTTRVLGLDIDLVNLRKETYSDESRNPQMEFGTPEEDAMRRDATVNAMFYNINSEQVEDLTGRGRQDLQAKLLRTPLEPHQTFKDDPLRVLRLIRFASRLGYKIDEEALAAMRLPEIKDALRRKISRERVGIELEKALHGPDPYEALRLVHETGLYETIFSDPSIDVASHYKPEVDGWRVIIEHLQDLIRSGGSLSELAAGDEDCFMAWMMACIVPYRNAPQSQGTQAGRKTGPPIAVTVIREGIKSNNKICDTVLASLTNQAEISDLVDRLHEQRRKPDKKAVSEDVMARDVLGMAIRRWGPTWRSQVIYGLLVDIANSGSTVDACDRRYSAFLDHVNSLHLQDVCSFKPIIDGTALAKALQMKPARWMKDALEVVMAYQLRHPDDATQENAIAQVQGSLNNQTGGELTASLIRHFLKLTIRPLFAKATPSSVTEAGRKNEKIVLPPKVTMTSMDEASTRPWKTEQGASSLELLRWCVKSLDRIVVEEIWPFAVPPVLALLDDWEPKYKQVGIELTRHLFAVTPPPLLAKTGLGQVFEDALMPCLTCIPTITPEDQSVLLLNELYPTLLALSRARYPSTSGGIDGNVRQTEQLQKIKLLDEVIRKGVIYGYTHCSQYPRIIALLFKHLACLLDEERIDSVKHLKYILPILTETLSHPLAADTLSSNSPPIDCLINAVKALEATMRNTWPRIPGYRGEIMKGLALCWIKLDPRTDEPAKLLRKEMRTAVAMLRAAAGNQVDFDADSHILIDADPRVKDLLSAK